MPTMKAITEHRYGSRQRFPGDEYEATDKDAKLLKAVGRAEFAAAVKSPSDLPKEVMQRAVPAPKAEEPADPEPKRGEYLRRDMKAEETTDLKPTPQASGRTGEAKPSPSSPQGQARKGPQRSSRGTKG